MSASGVYAAKGGGKGFKNGQPASRITMPQKFGPTVSIAPFRASMETGVVTTTSQGGWVLSLPETLPLAVTVVPSTTFLEAGAQVTGAAVQQGMWVRVAGSFDRTAHAFAATRVTILLPRVEGIVQTVSGTGLTVLSNRGDTVTVATTQSTKWLQTRALRQWLRGPGGRTGTGPQDGTPAPSATPALSATLVPSASPVLSVTPVLSATPSVSGSPSPVPGVTAPGAEVGDRVLVEGTAGADNTSITALRILVGMPAAQVAAFPDDSQGNQQ